MSQALSEESPTPFTAFTPLPDFVLGKPVQPAAEGDRRTAFPSSMDSAFDVASCCLSLKVQGDIMSTTDNAYFVTCTEAPKTASLVGAWNFLVACSNTAKTLLPHLV